MMWPVQCSSAPAGFVTPFSCLIRYEGSLAETWVSPEADAILLTHDKSHNPPIAPPEEPPSPALPQYCLVLILELLACMHQINNTQRPVISQPSFRKDQGARVCAPASPASQALVVLNGQHPPCRQLLCASAPLTPPCNAVMHFAEVLSMSSSSNQFDDQGCSDC